MKARIAKKIVNDCLNNDGWKRYSAYKIYRAAMIILKTKPYGVSNGKYKKTAALLYVELIKMRDENERQIES